MHISCWTDWDLISECDVGGRGTHIGHKVLMGQSPVELKPFAIIT
jgi:hypothetical protein